MQSLRVAAWAFSARDDLAANARAIARGLARAAEARAHVLLTPECALCGYPGAARDGLGGLDWGELASAEAWLAERARSLGILLVLGSVERARGGCYNVALACGAVRARRYRKRCLVPRERAVFAGGDRHLIIRHRGWRLGLGICFDLRFPDHWLGLAEAGADAFLVIAHMAGVDPDPGTKRRLIPQLCAVRAAETATPLVFCNTSDPDRHCPTLASDARGMPVSTRARGLLAATLASRARLDPWYRGIRDTAVERWRAASRG